jgi:hypothetical protein
MIYEELIDLFPVCPIDLPEYPEKTTDLPEITDKFIT